MGVLEQMPDDLGNKMVIEDGEIDNILNLLNEWKKRITYSTNKKIVLVLGNTSSDKSIFTQFVTDNDNHLVSVENKKDKGKFIIIDNDDKEMPQFFPTFLLDTEKNTVFYDIPEFGKNQNISQNVLTIYFLKKIVDFANSVKLVFTISYSPDTKAIDEQEFALLVEQVITLLNDLGQFKESILLVVTKVDIPNNNDETISDYQVIQNIEKFLEDMKNGTFTTKYSSEFKEKTIEFINILLRKGNMNGYKSIAIFKRPQQGGLIQNNQVLKENKEKLKQKINRNIKYIKHDEDYFNYTLFLDSESELESYFIETFQNKINNKIAMDIENIDKTVKINYQDQEKIMHDIGTLHDKFVAGYNILSETRRALFNISKSQELIELFTQTLNDLNITISNTNLQSITSNVDNLNFIEVIQNRLNKSKSHGWAIKLRNTIDYLKDSAKWYSFFIKLNNILSKYDIQKNIDKYNKPVRTFLSQIEDYENKNQDIIDNLKILLKNVSDENFKNACKSIKDLDLHEFKIRILKKILTLGFLQKLQTSCIDKELKIQGSYVKLQDIDQLINQTNCKTAKSIKIFALNKVFIDANFNKTGNQIQLSIIAPVWEIINKRKIILDGAPAPEVHISAIDGWESRNPAKRNGEDGVPGVPGGSSGRFIGIGKIFIDGKNLKISVNGGKGGAGQDGGDGFKGIDGSRPIEEDCSNKHVFYSWSCYHFGDNCTDGGNGGDGGVGGKGGHAEKVVLVSLDKQSEIIVSNTPGESGKDGKGGNGSNIPGKIGQYRWIRSDNGFRFVNSAPAGITHKKSDINYPQFAACHPGKSGIDGKNNAGIEDPKVEMMESPTDIINDYKNYVRQNVDNNLRESFLRKFVNQLENHKSTRDLYDTLAFIKELQDLENHFYATSNVSLFLPLYQSLLNRIKHYTNKLSNDKKSKDDMKVLYHLHAATQSKINNLKNYNADSLIIDLSKYLDSVINEFEQLRNLNDVASIHKYNNDYKNTIEKKTNEVRIFVETQIKTNIKKVLNEIDASINVMLNETISEQNEAIKNRKNMIDQQKGMISALILKSFMEVTKLASVFLNLLGPLGAVAGTMLNTGAVISSDIYPSESTDIGYNLPLITAEIQKPLAAVENIFKNKQKRFNEEIIDLEKELNSTSDNQLEDVKESLTETKKKIERHVLNPVDSDFLDNMNKERTEIERLLEKKKNQTGINNKNLVRLTRMQNTLKVSEAAFGFYKNFKNDKDKVEKIGNAIAAEEAKIRKFKHDENMIYKLIIPTCKSIQNLADTTQNRIKNQSHAALDISKWQVQSTLTDIKRQLKKMTEGYRVQEEFAILMDKLNEGINTMILLYDRIQEYQEKVELATFIAKINSPDNDDIEDETLRSSVNKLKLILQTNIVIEKYRKVVKAFGQYIYPFADRYLAGFYLPIDRQPENIDTVIRNATFIVKLLKSKLIDIETTLPLEMNDIFTGVIYSSDSEFTDPFYVWNYDDYKKDISELMEGNEIVLKADIKKGLDKNAVKFSNVRIRFKLHDTAKQIHFNELIRKFQITMIHLGNSYYKCDDKIHIISNQNITLKYTLGEKADLTNMVYSKINKSTALLSPYAMWSIKLTYQGKNKHMDMYNFLKYQFKPMNVELEGVGQHVDADDTYPSVCKNNLEKYYILDEILSNDLALLNKRRLRGPPKPKKRKTRALHEDLFEKNNETSFTTSGASRSMRFLFLDNIVNLIEGSFIAFQNFNPVNKIQQWFDKFDKNIAKKDLKIFNNDVSIAMELVNTQPAYTKFSKVSQSIVDDESFIKDKFLFDNSLFCHHNNLLLLNFLIRWKSGVKHENENGIMANDNFYSQYAQSLAFRGQIPNDKPSSY